VFCISCGHENVDDAKFCFNCGNTFDIPKNHAPPTNLKNNKMDPLPIAVSQDSLTGGLTEEEHQTARTFAVLALLLVLFSIFGGATASWWIMHSGGPSDYQDEDFRWIFGLKETEISDEDDSESWDYDDSDVDLDEVEDIMKMVTNLGYISIVAASFFTYSAFNQGKDGLFLDAGKEETLLRASMFVGIMGFLIAGYFAVNWPDAFEDDTEIDIEESFFGSNVPDEPDDRYTYEYLFGTEMISWKPWLGWGAMLFSGFLGLAYYLTVKLQ